VAGDARPRTNRARDGGRAVGPADTLLLDQVERVEALAPFAQLSWAPDAALLVDAGARRDRVRFAARDRFVRDGRDDSGARTLGAASGHAGASYALAAAFAPYANVSTAFETPTTTELQARAAARHAAAFNADLGPQRARGVEVGARGALGGGRVTYTARRSAPTSTTRSCSGSRPTGAPTSATPARRAAAASSSGCACARCRAAAGGRRTRSRSPRRTPTRASASPTTACGRARGRHARRPHGAGRARAVRARRACARGRWRSRRRSRRSRSTPTTRGRRRSTPTTATRCACATGGAAARRAAAVGRRRGAGRRRRRRRPRAAAPFVAVQNAFGQRYVGSVTVNGANGRVLEPAPGRTAYAGLQVGG
jgi:hypothetical protein